MTNCHFVIHGTRDDTFGLLHHSIPSSTHYHPASSLKSVYPSFHQLDPAEQQELVNLISGNI
jgi:hypothetical protein